MRECPRDPSITVRDRAIPDGRQPERRLDAGFVMPGRMREACRKAKHGLVVLTGSNGIETTAEHLLAKICAPGTTLVRLAEGFDLRNWSPARDGGYILRAAACLLECPASLSDLATRLREAHATLVIFLPAGRLTDQARQAAAEYLVQCLPPDPMQVFTKRIVAGAKDPDTLLRNLPDGFLSRFLTPWSSPQDAVDVAEALVLHESPAGLTRDRANDVRARLDRQADLETGELLRRITDPDVMDVLISSAAFRGRSQQIILSEAERLASLREDPADRRFDGTHALAAAAQLEGVRIEPEAHDRSGIVFPRSGWADALLRHVWANRPSGPLSRWLAGITDATLVEQAGWALGLSVPQRLRPLRPNEIRSCALRREPLAAQVAAAALRALLNGSAQFDEVAKILAGWTCGDNEHLHYLAALTCGSDSVTAPLGPSLTLIRRLARRLEADHHPLTDEAVRKALLAHFRSGDRRVILKELVAWTSHGEGEAAYATWVFPTLLQSDLHWFHDRIRPGGDEGASTVLLIQRTLRRHGPGGRLRGVLTTWQRLASRHPADTNTFGKFLEAVGADKHPRVQEFLRDLHCTN